MATLLEDYNKFLSENSIEGINFTPQQINELSQYITVSKKHKDSSRRDLILKNLELTLDDLFSKNPKITQYTHEFFEQVLNERIDDDIFFRIKKAIIRKYYKSESDDLLSILDIFESQEDEYIKTLIDKELDCRDSIVSSKYVVGEDITIDNITDLKNKRFNNSYLEYLGVKRPTIYTTTTTTTTTESSSDIYIGYVEVVAHDVKTFFGKIEEEKEKIREKVRKEEQNVIDKRNERERQDQIEAEEKARKDKEDLLEQQRKLEEEQQKLKKQKEYEEKTKLDAEAKDKAERERKEEEERLEEEKERIEREKEELKRREEFNRQQKEDQERVLRVQEENRLEDERKKNRLKQIKEEEEKKQRKYDNSEEAKRRAKSAAVLEGAGAGEIKFKETKNSLLLEGTEQMESDNKEFLDGLI